MDTLREYCESGSTNFWHRCQLAARSGTMRAVTPGGRAATPVHLHPPRRILANFVHASPQPSPPARPAGYDEALAFLYGRIDYERANRGRNNYRFRLRCTAELFAQLGLGHYLYASPQLTDRWTDSANPETIARGSNAPPVPLVHIAGTKGKGSTATMVSSILASAGRRVGLYTSPHLTDLEERFRINGVPCDRAALVELVDAVRPVVASFEAAGDPVSFFELTTAMAILHFDRNRCDAIVLEVGLGGRLDSTNVCASTVTAITSIGLDHQHVLGDTIAEIAAEKAGIIKPDIPLVCGATKPDAIQTIAAVAKQKAAPFFLRNEAFRVRQTRDFGLASELTFVPRNEALVDRDRRSRDGQAPASEETYLLSLGGAHQVENAALAIAITRLLGRPERHQPISVPPTAIDAALRAVRCIGRIERFAVANSSTPEQVPVQVIVDTAHNEDSTTALCEAIDRQRGHDAENAADRSADCDSRSSSVRPRPASISPVDHHSIAVTPSQPTPSQPLNSPVVIVFATSRDKDADAMAGPLLAIADEVVCTRYTTNPRAYEPQRLADCFASRSEGPAVPRIRCQAEPFLALREAIHAASPGGTVVVCGSFFLAGQLRPFLLSLPGARPIYFDAPAHVRN